VIKSRRDSWAEPVACKGKVKAPADINRKIWRKKTWQIYWQMTEQHSNQQERNGVVMCRMDRAGSGSVVKNLGNNGFF